MMPVERPKKLVNWPHLAGVAASQIIVHGDDVNALSGKRVQIRGKCGDERFAFTGSHFSDSAAMKRDAADHLNVVMAFTENAPCSFANDRESFGQNMIESFAVGDALLEFFSLCPKLSIGEWLDLGFKLIDSSDDRIDRLQLTVILCAEDFSGYL